MQSFKERVEEQLALVEDQTAARLGDNGRDRSYEGHWEEVDLCLEMWRNIAYAWGNEASHGSHGMRNWRRKRRGRTSSDRCNRP